MILPTAVGEKENINVHTYFNNENILQHGSRECIQMEGWQNMPILPNIQIYIYTLVTCSHSLVGRLTTRQHTDIKKKSIA